MNMKYIPDSRSQLHFTLEIEETYVVVHFVESNIEFFNTSNILGFLEKVLSDLGNPTVVLDMITVTAIDSSGIGLMITLHKLLRESGHHLLLINVGETAARVFKLTSMGSFLKTFASIEDAERFIASN
jgi:anti-sigma B factor antagonist